MGIQRLATLAFASGAVSLASPVADAASAVGAGAPITVFTARQVVTMDPGWPAGTAVAVRDGKVLSVGRSMEDLAPWLDAARRDGTAVTLDDTFKDLVLVPGFVEAHGHPLIGAIALSMPSLSHFPQQNPYGPEIPGIKDIAAVERAIAAHLASHPADGRAVLFWGYDVAAMGRHLDKAFLDRVAGDRAVWVWDASEHFVYGSSAALRERGVTGSDVAINGVIADPDGEPSGQFLGTTAASWVLGPTLTLGVPIYLHPTYPCRAMTDLYCADYAARFPQFPNAAWGFAVETGSIAIRMVLSGVFGKHPGLRCILGHFGETLPFHLWRLNHTLSVPGPDGLDFAATFRRHFWLTSSGLFSNHALACSIAGMGVDRVMFSVDWPYERADEAVAWARAVPLGAEDRARFLGGNARELLRL